MPSVSKKQQKFMGIVRSIQKGEQPASKFSKSAQKAAKKMRDEFDKTGELPPHLKKIVKGKKEFEKKFKVKDIEIPGLEWMSKLGEAADRDYKAEYKKFQSSTKAKKYRAELNKYNRQKGTYGNGDGKDASHKGGKIVGFEAESKNRGRAEKSRLKKEINDYVGSVIDETINENPAAIAAAQRMVVQSKGKKISVNTARNSRYKDKDPAAHKKAKSIFQRIVDKFKKKKVKEAMSPKVKRMMINAINDEAAMDDFLKKYGKYIPKKLDKSITRYRDDIYDAERGYGDDRVAKKYLIKIFMKYINEGTCGYGLEGELGEEPAGPKLLKKIKAISKKKKNESLSPQTLLQIAKQMREVDESVNEIKIWDLNEKCWKGYEKKGMKTMFGKRYPNCVKKKK